MRGKLAHMFAGEIEAGVAASGNPDGQYHQGHDALGLDLWQADQARVGANVLWLDTTADHGTGVDHAGARIAGLDIAGTDQKCLTQAAAGQQVKAAITTLPVQASTVQVR